MKKITIGIIAHVDSGKTTLSEALLYLTGSIRSFGRVDKGASFFDNESLERKRGITIFSKQARFEYRDTSFVLIDTPGHADFSAETERTLQVLDYAVLLISASDGIKGQTKLLWELLKRYAIPTFIFFNKMDQEGADKSELLKMIRELSSDTAVDLTSILTKNSEDQDVDLSAKHLDRNKHIYEQIAMCSEDAMEEFLSTGLVKDETICKAIASRRLFPCLFGAAIKMEGVEDLLDILDRFTMAREYPEEFSARVYKISRDNNGNRLTFVKITGGSLKNKSLLPDGDGDSKINEIRFYSGDKFYQEDVATAGDICALTGLRESFSGQGFGTEQDTSSPVLIPVLSYRAIVPNGEDPVQVLPMFKKLEEESPELLVTWDEDNDDIYVFVMGKVQLEIVTTLLKERFNLDVEFDSGEVMYKETISKAVTGVGHFEPLRHYAEVHLLMEPLPLGSGMVFDTDLSSDVLAKNWQRLILTHLAEKMHKGVLTGSPITDMKITLVAGKAHLKHTEGGDFRQAVYRAVRQGLMMTENVLLEPFYRFILEVPTENVGRALNDLDIMNAEFSSPDIDNETDTATITGRGPVSALKDYQPQIASYTKGLGTISVVTDGYGPCHNAEEVIAAKGYAPEKDTRNTADSVFCTHGAGYIVPYDEVYDHMHIPFENNESPEHSSQYIKRSTASDIPLGTDEIDNIIAGFASSNSRSKKAENTWKKKYAAGSSPSDYPAHFAQSQKPFINVFPLEKADIVVVDGYNVIFAWDELSLIAKEDIGAARDALIDHLSKYHSMVSSEIVVVFDAYKVKGRAREDMRFKNIRVIYTMEDETADQYIERFTNKLDKKTKAAVVTSDATEQVVTMGQGCKLVSSREFKEKISAMERSLNESYNISSSE